MHWVPKACFPIYGLFAGRVREINREDKAHSMEQLSKAGASMWTQKRQHHQTHDSAFHSHIFPVLLFILLHE